MVSRPRSIWIFAALVAGGLSVAAHAIMGVPVGSTTVFLGIAALALFLALWSMQAMVRGLIDDPLVGIEGDIALGGGTLAELREEKKRVLKAIKELDFDHDMGKLAQGDYQEVRDRYRLRAVQVMRALDDGGSLHPDAQRVAEGEPPRERQARIATESPSTTECPSCGQHNDLDARFCKNCGQKLDLQAEQ